MKKHGFTLTELLVVVAIILTAVALLVPILLSSLERGRSAICRQNLRMLHLANTQFSDHHGSFVPAAEDIIFGNKQRWHGRRDGAGDPFNGGRGPLAPYLGKGKVARSCPGFRRFATSGSANAFESSCGGYGYNALGVGSRIYLEGFRLRAMAQGMDPNRIESPYSTVMFVDAAFPQPYGSEPAYLIEYSFAEPYHWVFQAGEESAYRADPSIHFRHNGHANVVWCDGHVTGELMETQAEEHFTKWDVGWFGPGDNSLFDPY